MPELPEAKVKEGFDKPGLMVINEKQALPEWLRQQAFDQSVLLFMSSGNYDGMDLFTFAKEITSL